MLISLEFFKIIENLDIRFEFFVECYNIKTNIFVECDYKIFVTYKSSSKLICHLLHTSFQLNPLIKLTDESKLILNENEGMCDKLKGGEEMERIIGERKRRNYDIGKRKTSINKRI